jgi:prolyl oligopeptidase
MIGLSEGFSDTITWREFDLQKQTFLADGFVLPPSVGLVQWKDPDTLLVAADWGLGTMSKYGAPISVRSWKRGQARESAIEVFRGTMGRMVVLKSVRLSSKEQLIYISDISPLDDVATYWVQDSSGQFVKTALPPLNRPLMYYSGEIVFELMRDWQIGNHAFSAGALLSVPVADLQLSVPRVKVLMELRPRESIYMVGSTRDGIVVSVFRNARGNLAKFTLMKDRWAREEIVLPENGSVSIRATDPANSLAFVIYESFLQPPAIYSIDTSRNSATCLRQQVKQFDDEAFTVSQLEATSRDGTKIPYFLINRKQSQITGKVPTLLYAYGSGIPQYPSYVGPVGPLWLEQGGAYVVANVRGGGEFGPTWLATGIERQHVYDDFFAVAEDLVNRNITSPRHLGIKGHSSGGLLVGVAITQRPELFGAAVLQASPLDLINGLGNTSSGGDEYGSLDIPEQRQFMLRTSPYQNLRLHTDWPAPLIMASTSDDRVHPAYSRKFAAKMEALGMPFLYYESPEGGHNLAATPDQEVSRDALVFAYLTLKLM